MLSGAQKAWEILAEGAEKHLAQAEINAIKARCKEGRMLTLHQGTLQGIRQAWCQAIYGCTPLSKSACGSSKATCKGNCLKACSLAPPTFGTKKTQVVEESKELAEAKCGAGCLRRLVSELRGKVATKDEALSRIEAQPSSQRATPATDLLEDLGGSARSATKWLSRKGLLSARRKSAAKKKATAANKAAAKKAAAAKRAADIAKENAVRASLHHLQPQMVLQRDIRAMSARCGNATVNLAAAVKKGPWSVEIKKMGALATLKATKALWCAGKRIAHSCNASTIPAGTPFEQWPDACIQGSHAMRFLRKSSGTYLVMSEVYPRRCAVRKVIIHVDHNERKPSMLGEGSGNEGIVDVIKKVARGRGKSDQEKHTSLLLNKKLAVYSEEMTAMYTKNHIQCTACFQAAVANATAVAVACTTECLVQQTKLRKDIDARLKQQAEERRQATIQETAVRKMTEVAAIMVV